MAVTRSKSYAPALDGPLKYHRKHTAKYAAKLQAQTEAAAMKRAQGEQAEYKRLMKDHEEKEAKLAKRTAELKEEKMKAWREARGKTGGTRRRGRKSRYTRRR